MSSIAKKAVDSTVKRILLHMAEIIASIGILVLICLPLVFAIPIWFQIVLLESPFSDLLVNPVAWFGASGAMMAIIALAFIGLIIVYPIINKIASSGLDVEDKEEYLDEEEDIDKDMESEGEDEEIDDEESDETEE
ncbi:MAG: hypothetical protein BAJATHORv1_10094 [Candidatus Thorarchaeota archaeon]|nr:MAG: hypothetical protein BAJATHORv1_10094 [Candidatus Thorarchaeota archaeon]